MSTSTSPSAPAPDDDMLRVANRTPGLDMAVVGHRIARRMRELDLCNADLARLTGLWRQEIGHYVRGTKEPRAENKIAIARALGMDVDMLFAPTNLEAIVPKSTGDFEPHKFVMAQGRTAGKMWISFAGEIPTSEAIKVSEIMDRVRGPANRK